MFIAEFDTDISIFTSTQFYFPRTCYQHLLLVIISIRIDLVKSLILAAVGCVLTTQMLEEQLKKLVQVVDYVCADVQRAKNIYNKLFYR